VPSRTSGGAPRASRLDVRYLNRFVFRARRQAGLISRAQLLAAKVSSSAIGRGLAAGTLAPLHPGVYRLAGVPDSTDLLPWAAVLWAGDGAVLSHRSAAWWIWRLDGLGRRPPDIVELSVRRSQHLIPPPRIRLYRAAQLRRGADVGLVRGLPCTSLERTLIDLASVLDRLPLEQALDSAARRNRGVYASTREALTRLGSQGRAGTAVLAQLLALEPISPTGSPLEVRVRAALRQAGIPVPMPQLVIEDRNGDLAAVVDFAWPKERVVLFVHSREFHSTPLAHEKDFRQIAALSAANWTVLPLTSRRFDEERESVIEELKHALGLRD
jgi:hypothetical protein